MAHDRHAGGFSEAGDDVDDAGRQAAVGEVIGEFERGERSLLGGLEDTGAACGNRRRQLPCGH